jgi:hypothetical protein
MGDERIKTQLTLPSSKSYDWVSLISAIKSCPTPEDFLSTHERATQDLDRDPFHGIDA